MNIIQNNPFRVLGVIANARMKDIQKNIGNMILFAFAGHDTTGHTLTWLLYELCKHPEHKQRLIEEIDEYWLNNPKENYTRMLRESVPGPGWSPKRRNLV